ncbi:ciliary microtubule inner protein 1-like [Periplaneta americana]|uniref:ciliary microtubule inner protein 1-like n=1 Tax=Periplaneta americana TaxID=6978 RepID=UPI0037E7249B
MSKPQNEYPTRMQLKYNVVKYDGRLKEVIRLEKLTRKQWEKKWGFSRNLMKIYHDAIEAEGLELEKKSSRPWLVAKTDMKVPPSPSVPQTSSGFVGWRSSVSECALEKVGPLYVSPKLTIEPPEDGQSCSQRNIFVG